MAHESFEDEEAAAILNRDYVCIKVDKEERPDIDSVYMSVCQAVTGQGGWPLTIIMDTDQKPFFAGTYLPKSSRSQMYGLIELLGAIDEKWKYSREELLASGNQIAEYLLKEKLERNDYVDGLSLISEAEMMFCKTFDKTFGGFGSEPKFPTPHHLMFLLRYAHENKDAQALYMVESTLEHMYRGGIYDHIGYGFSRYSTDRKWLVPHFEKMLYDNALLVIIYCEMYQKTKNSIYKKVAKETLQYLRRELRDKNGGFYCAQDADSEGIEGKYYVFMPKEIKEAVGEESGELFNSWYDITESGNFEGKSIPNLINNTAYLEIKADIENMKKEIYEYRKKRTKLHRDDKIITSWNSLVIVSCSIAYRVLGEEEYLNMAKGTMAFIEENMVKNYQLFLSYRDGAAYGTGHIDDYAFYVWGLLELYQVTYEIMYLEKALEYHHKTMDLFFDKENGGCCLYSREAEQLLIRPKEFYDGAIPSGNSVAAYNMQRLARITGDISIQKEADSQMKVMKSKMISYPVSYAFGLIGVMQAEYSTQEVVIVLEDDMELLSIKKALEDIFIPNTLVIIKTKHNQEQLERIVPYIKDYQSVNGKTTYYICENKMCASPMQDLSQLMKRLS